MHFQPCQLGLKNTPTAPLQRGKNPCPTSVLGIILHLIVKLQFWILKNVESTFSKIQCGVHILYIPIILKFYFDRNI